MQIGGGEIWPPAQSINRSQHCQKWHTLKPTAVRILMRSDEESRANDEGARVEKQSLDTAANNVWHGTE